MKKLVEKVTSNAAVAHWMRALQRYNVRLGAQSAAAITYFSVLALMPVIMVAFAAVGLTLTVFRPDLLELIKETVTSQMTAGQLADSMKSLIDQAANSWRGVGPIGLLLALWAGQGWIGNLKSAVRAQLRDDADRPEAKSMVLLEALINIGIMFGLLLGVLLTFALNSATTALGGTVLGWLGLQGTPAGVLGVQVIGLVANLLAAFLLFMFLLLVFPERRPPLRFHVQGALLGAIGTTALQSLTTVLIKVFAGNATAAVFGSVIIVMLFFNLFAQLIIITAAWVGTGESSPSEVTAQAEAPEESSDEALDAEAPAFASTPDVVPGDVARHGVRVGMGMGYVTGAATGLGLGALVGAVAAKLKRN